MLEVHLPTLVIWATDDTALPSALLDGLGDFVPQVTLCRVESAMHWIVHKQPLAGGQRSSTIPVLSGVGTALNCYQ
jgi:pimeloyl-ACP methyl ester carboxylesterase